MNERYLVLEVREVTGITCVFLFIPNTGKKLWNINDPTYSNWTVIVTDGIPPQNVGLNRVTAELL